LSEGYLQRKAAWEILLKVSSGINSDKALEKTLANYKFNTLDIAFITELSYGCIRFRRFLDHWIDFTSKLSHEKQPPKLRWLLHIGLYQILKMNRIPYSASISTTVEIAKKTDLKKLSGVVNAILRNATRKVGSNNTPVFPLDESERIALQESLPIWLVKEMIDWFGVIQTKMIAKTFNRNPKIDLRINLLKTTVDESIKVFNQNNIDVEIIKDLNSGIVLKSKPRSIKSLPGYIEGKWIIQDRSSQWVVPLLNPKEGDRILDACSAPGTKTTHLAELIKDRGEILAIDRSENRLRLLKENLERLNIKSVKVFKADAIKLFEIKPNYINYFDKILLDVPCSGIGTLSRNPDARWKLSINKIKQLISIQEKLLENIIPLLNKNGSFVYSTCTICPDENNLLIKKFLNKNKKLELVFEKQILPSDFESGDGFYAAKICYKK
tara:strand:+ start:1931 stop:3247 length:1317 start_codon:yes stop_codon:yes gene_type:complete